MLQGLSHEKCVNFCDEERLKRVYDVANSAHIMNKDNQ